MKAFAFVLLCASILWGCADKGAGPHDENCNLDEYLALHTGNWWVYTGEQTYVTSYPTGEPELRGIENFRDSIVVMGSTIFDGHSSYELHVHRNGTPFDTLFVALEGDSILWSGNIFYSVDCTCLHTKMLSGGTCPSRERTTVNSLTMEADPLPTIDKDGNLVNMIIGHKITVANATSNASTPNYPDVKMFQLWDEDSSFIVSPDDAVFAVSGSKSYKQTSRQEIQVVKNVGIISWSGERIADFETHPTQPKKTVVRFKRTLVRSSVH